MYDIIYVYYNFASNKAEMLTKKSTYSYTYNNQTIDSQAQERNLFRLILLIYFHAMLFKNMFVQACMYV